MNKTLLLTSAAALMAPTFGQNDDCAGAVALAAATPTAFDTSAATTNPADPAWPCAFGGGPDIWFSYTVVGAGVDVEVSTCNNATYDTAIQIFTGGCGSLTSLVCNDDGPGCSGFSSLATATGLTAGTNLLIRVGGYNGATGTGTLTLTEVVGPCSAPDVFEDNDDCAGAVSVTDGTYPMLNVNDGDNDFYAVTVPAGGTLDATILFIDAVADVDLYLWDPLVACDTNVVGQGTGTGALVVGFSASDDENIVYTNATGAAQNLILEVDMYSSGGCNSYDLIVVGAGVGGPGPIGTNYCSTNPNSSGASGAMSAFGETSVAANDVTLTASGLPANQFGIFITSTTTGFVPNAGGTSNGNLCLGGQIGRYVGPGQIVSSGAMGEFSLAIDLAAIPQGSGTVAAVAGTSRSFQAWHRDIVGFGSNFTDGITISFTN